MRSSPVSVALLAALLLAGPVAAQRTQKPVLHGRHWVAITGKPLGATAGAMMFQQGGNAIIAACWFVGLALLLLRADGFQGALRTLGAVGLGTAGLAFARGFDSPWPLGVAAAIYLSEYAPDNWFTRAINLAIINLAGVPSIVHALFGVGAFVIFFRFGTSILAASLTLAIMTLPVVIVATPEPGCWPRRASWGCCFRVTRRPTTPCRPSASRSSRGCL